MAGNNLTLIHRICDFAYCLVEIFIRSRQARKVGSRGLIASVGDRVAR
jgi:hypothetical protein